MVPFMLSRGGKNVSHQYYAHSLEGKPPEEWQPLEEIGLG